MIPDDVEKRLNDLLIGHVDSLKRCAEHSITQIHEAFKREIESHKGAIELAERGLGDLLGKAATVRVFDELLRGAADGSYWRPADKSEVSIEVRIDGAIVARDRYDVAQLPVGRYRTLVLIEAVEDPACRTRSI